MRKASLLTAVLAIFALTAAAAAAGISTKIPFTSSLTYHETSQGKDVGETTIGAEGQGTISMRVAGPAAALLPQLLTKGAPYVVRHDIDAKGTYKSVMVMTFGSPTLGTLCVAGNIGFGRYDPNAGTGFPPTSGSFHSVGGTGLAARLSMSGTYKATTVTGSEDTLLKATSKGTVTVSAVAARAPSKACVAVAKLARR